jgi:hypothetical protein
LTTRRVGNLKMKITRGARTYLKKERFEIVREILLSVVISTLISGSVAFYFNRIIDRRTSRRQFIYDFSRTFTDNPKYRNVSIAIEDQYLYGKEERISEINEYDIDDYLGLVSDMWSFYKDGYVTKEIITDQYGYYLCITYKSELIKNYRSKLTKAGFNKESNYPFLEAMAIDFEFDKYDCKDF